MPMFPYFFLLFTIVEHELKFLLPIRFFYFYNFFFIWLCLITYKLTENREAIT